MTESRNDNTTWVSASSSEINSRQDGSSKRLLSNRKCEHKRMRLLSFGTLPPPILSMTAEPGQRSIKGCPRRVVAWTFGLDHDHLSIDRPRLGCPFPHHPSRRFRNTKIYFPEADLMKSQAYLLLPGIASRWQRQ
jgi:hypothetical protein